MQFTVPEISSPTPYFKPSNQFIKKKKKKRERQEDEPFIGDFSPRYKRDRVHEI